jgi:acetyl-CoA acetyltransferase
MPVPIVVGVADVKNRSQKVEDAIEPKQLMLQAIKDALQDAGGSSQKLQSSIDSIAAVRTWTWPYADLLGLLSEELGIKPKYKHYSDHGGNQPCKIFDDAARRIAKGESKVAVVTGGEALASRAYIKIQKQRVYSFKI